MNRVILLTLICFFFYNCDIDNTSEDSVLDDNEVTETIQKNALCVVVDFSDYSLEDYSGSVINAVTTIEGINQLLSEMELHWFWLSNGYEEISWNLIRIQMDESLSTTSYDNWVDFRTAVVNKALLNIDISEYDYNSDNICDSMWIFVANNGYEYDYLVGGASHNGGIDEVHDGANVFVDTQTNLSVTSGSYGNFNHEVGHNFGLPDLYGEFDNIHYLSLMSDSWRKPANNFTCWEKYQLGWLDPIIINEDRSNIVLSPSEEELNAVLIETEFVNEFFMIEYRKKPSSGYGSGVNIEYNGLTIYHINENTNSYNNNSLPQLIHLERIDNLLTTPPVEDDFLNPDKVENSSNLNLKTYYSSEYLFEINNLKWDENDNILFDIQYYPDSHQLNNLISNGNFEEGSGIYPENWNVQEWTSGSTFIWETNGGIDDSRCIKIVSSTENDATFKQEITNLIPGETYRFTGMIKVQNIDNDNQTNKGACLSLYGTWERSEFIYETDDWTQINFDFVPETATVTLGARLGFWGNTVSGEVMFDDLALYLIQ